MVQTLASRSSAVGAQIANKTKSQDLHPYLLTVTFCSTFPEDWDLLFYCSLVQMKFRERKTNTSPFEDCLLRVLVCPSRMVREEEKARKEWETNLR